MFHKCVSFGHYGQWIVAVMATICSLSSGQSYAFAAAALPKFKDGSAGVIMSDDEAAWMVTLTFIGSIISPIPSGILMDRIGRRSTLLLTLLLAIVSWLILAFLPYTMAVLIARFLAGMWGGVVYTVVPAFLGEVVDPKIRGSMAALFSFMLYFGALYESVAANLSYQAFILVSAIPSIALFIAFLFLPESPYFHLMNGNREMAKESIIWLRGHCKDFDLDQLQEKVEEQLQIKGSFLDIFRTKAARKAFIIVEVLQILQRSSGITFLFSYTTVVVPDSWVSAENSFTVLAIDWMVFSLISSVVIAKYNRKTLLAFSCLGSGIAMFVVTVWYYLRDFTTIDTTSTQWLPLVFLIVSGTFYCFGIVCIPQLVQGELFPVNIKSTGSAIASITGNLFAVVNTKFFYDINKCIGVYFNFLIMAIAPVICIVFIYTVMIETKGQSLESIQDILNGKPKEPLKPIPA